MVTKPNLLRRHVAAHIGMLQHVAGEAVTYRRGNDAVNGVTAVMGSTRHDDYGADGFNATGREQDWIFVSQDLPWVPERGDEIDWIDPQGQRHTFQVLPRLDDRCFRYTDQTRHAMRVYTVETLRSVE